MPGNYTNTERLDPVQQTALASPAPLSSWLDIIRQKLSCIIVVKEIAAKSARLQKRTTLWCAINLSPLLERLERHNNFMFLVHFNVREEAARTNWAEFDCVHLRFNRVCVAARTGVCGYAVSKFDWKVWILNFNGFWTKPEALRIWKSPRLQKAVGVDIYGGQCWESLNY